MVILGTDVNLRYALMPCGMVFREIAGVGSFDTGRD